MTDVIERLERFEDSVIEAQYFHSIQLLHSLLSDYQLTIQIDNLPDDYYQRLVLGIFQLFTDDRFVMSEQQYQLLCANHPTIAMVINLAGLENADHILAQLVTFKSPVDIEIKTQSDSFKGLLLYNLNSYYELNLLEFSRDYPKLIAPIILGLLATKCLITQQSEKRFNQLLEQDWSHLSDYRPSLANMICMSNSWMYCSYAHTKNKHRIKSTLNQIIKNWLPDFSPQLKHNRHTASTCRILVPLEVMNHTHAMFRCFGRTLQELSRHFHTIALSPQNNIDEQAGKCFSEVMSFNPVEAFTESESFIQRLIDLQCDVVYYPSLGMANYTLLIANHRLAPIQLYTLGHPATTHIDNIDYAIVQEQDFVSAEVFSEKVLITGDEMSSTTSQVYSVETISEDMNKTDKSVHVAITSTHMKINYQFFNVCRKIEKQSKSNIFFHVFPAAEGYLLKYLEQEFARLLNNLHVYETTDFATYIQNLSQCHVRLGTFPFGGANSNMDCFGLAIPFIAMKGIEPHAQSDVGQLKQANLQELIATDQQDYIEKAIKLIDDPVYRIKISDQMKRLKNHAFFSGKVSQEGSFVKTVKWIMANHDKVQKSNQQVWSLQDQQSS